MDKKQFIKKGGKPKLEYPIYMSLGKELMIENDPEYKQKVILPLSLFSKNDLSFTYLDSMHTQEGKKPYVFMLNEIEDMIDTYGSGYTEAQIWNTEPLKKIKDDYFSTGRSDFINS